MPTAGPHGATTLGPKPPSPDDAEFELLSVASTEASADESISSLADCCASPLGGASACSSDDWPVLRLFGLPDGSAGGFYGLMCRTREIRLELVESVLRGDSDGRAWFSEALRGAFRALSSLERPASWRAGDDEDLHLLRVDSLTPARLSLRYEKRELERDVCFLEGGTSALLQLLRREHEQLRTKRGYTWLDGDLPSWFHCVETGLEALRSVVGVRAGLPRRFRNFITDRDGTINNYCDRYASSVQSAYNAIWLCEFARHCAQSTVVLTAAPLGGRPGAPGLVELCTMPDGLVALAGSKGREYFDEAHGEVVELEPLRSDVDELLSDVHRRLRALCSGSGNAKFLGLGSGLQRKCGELTMSRNDPARTVSDTESLRFMKEVECVLSEVDPTGHLLAMNDTGTDMEIFPVLLDRRPSFSKGDGVELLDRSLGLRLRDGPNLICGDTASDVPMIEAALSAMPKVDCTCLAVLFVVTADQHRQTPTLANRVCSLCSDRGAHCVILPSPDVLMAVLAKFTAETVCVALGGVFGVGGG